MTTLDESRDMLKTSYDEFKVEQININNNLNKLLKLKKQQCLDEKV